MTELRSDMGHQVPPCRPGDGHRAISWHPTIDKEVKRYAIEQRILQLQNENARLAERERRMRELDARIAALWPSSSSSATQAPPPETDSPT